MTRQSHTVFSDKVADLVGWSTYSWNYDLIPSTFWSVHIHDILPVPIGSPMQWIDLFGPSQNLVSLRCALVIIIL